MNMCIISFNLGLYFVFFNSFQFSPWRFCDTTVRLIYTYLIFWGPTTNWILKKGIKGFFFCFLLLCLAFFQVCILKYGFFVFFSVLVTWNINFSLIQLILLPEVLRSANFILLYLFLHLLWSIFFSYVFCDFWLTTEFLFFLWKWCEGWDLEMFLSSHFGFAFMNLMPSLPVISFYPNCLTWRLLHSWVVYSFKLWT